MVHSQDILRRNIRYPRLARPEYILFLCPEDIYRSSGVCLHFFGRAFWQNVLGIYCPVRNKSIPEAYVHRINIHIFGTNPDGIQNIHSRSNDMVDNLDDTAAGMHHHLKMRGLRRQQYFG